jgi:hypothetical protein
MYKSIKFIQILFDEFVGFSSGLRLNLAKILQDFFNDISI